MSRRRHRREFPEGELALAAMIDMMINVLIFLLTLYGTAPIELHSGPDLTLPKAKVGEPVLSSIVLVVSRTAVSVDDQEILRLVDKGGVAALPEKVDVDAVQSAFRSAVEARATGEAGEAPDLSIQCDQSVPWEVLGPVLSIAAAAGVGEYRFVAYAEE